MFYLSLVTLIWGFSFSLVGVYLSDQVDPYFSVLIRLALSFFLFSPFLKFRGIPKILIIKLMLIGACQLGLMYSFYYQSFRFISVQEVISFSVFTPIYITLLYDFLKGSFSLYYLFSSIISIIAVFFVQFRYFENDFLVGFFIVQFSNLCFAIGQTCYKHFIEEECFKLPQKRIFGYFYCGALFVAIIEFIWLGDFNRLPSNSLQWAVLIYLGLIASGFGYFMWNKGACMVNAGTLAVMNNALIPVGLIVNLLIWNKDVNLVRVLISGSVLCLVLLFNAVYLK
ncbi:EamA family transporter [Candidatus Photodesmus anomalopis]|uniref:EamA domain-containing protein n=1 Tax=Candidatus Photodesmus katoptron Akat1 TaxID=1236703 RepID=S3E063_9GAMM|nr:EamA family transporter [Candidatus Photodesmus katoptron]EPE37596.1 hypothetical protein O1U_0050 [Candidatus Photodesmus katoptron Akat1]